MSFHQHQTVAGNVPVVGAEPGGCPVCGDPGSNCTSGRNEVPRIIGEGLYPSLNHENVHVVQEDVVVERQVTADVKTRVKVATKGQVIPMSRARELGLVE